MMDPAFLKKAEDILPDVDSDSLHVGKMVERQFHDEGDVFVLECETVKDETKQGENGEVRSDEAPGDPECGGPKEYRREMDTTARRAVQGIKGTRSAV